MDVSTGGSKYNGDDWFGASDGHYVAAIILWRDEYDVCSVRNWFGFANFVLY